MGERFRLYPVGEGTQIVHALNFAIRAALSFGGVQRGDRESIAAYLAKTTEGVRPGVRSAGSDTGGRGPGRDPQRRVAS